MEKIEDLNKKSYDSQLKIYKALRQILITKSLNDITVTDICEECNCSRSTFYRNFDNVIDILEIFFDYFYDRYLKKRVNEENQLLFFLKYWTRSPPARCDIYYVCIYQNNFHPRQKTQEKIYLLYHITFPFSISFL